ncbi:MAG: poly-gamma-glutamate biosynthesis protein [Deltaproteobacteria bacterium HGW-Deltaproteobacteria-15]|jgi:poly-gamma-glutamate synthesis protein (capsule biosynthesis protein)|nr:MAG: poly-gamma-glutamate biosynthesis protein [Deltaproteobacteria bacterium HGW-Deltaproteobacteria-15]
MSTGDEHQKSDSGRGNSELLTLFLCGDVMTGRGIDQILPHPSHPEIHEGYIKDATGYVDLAERVNGPIPRGVDPAYIWGDAIGELERVKPDVKIINLETSVTRSDDYWKGKGINYRMHPENIGSITAAGIDICSIANNHVLDWGYAGLRETLETLRKAKIRWAGAGMDLSEAQAPAFFEVEGKGRVVLFAFGSPSSGVPVNWGAAEQKPGINLLSGYSDESIMRIRERVERVKRARDVVVFSVHWGGNWGYGVPEGEVEFAHRLIDDAGVDLVYGHSSHHAKGIEVYRERLILYGCGDFLNDYEGIGGYEGFRDDLSLMYFADFNTLTGRLVRLEMRPTKIKNFRVNLASREDARWLADVLDREGKSFGTRVKKGRDNVLTLQWGESRGDHSSTPDRSHSVPEYLLSHERLDGPMSRIDRKTQSQRFRNLRMLPARIAQV